MEVYADEIINEDYICFGCLFVPTNQRDVLIDRLNNMRCLGKSNQFVWNYDECEYKSDCKIEYHTINNSEIHFRKIDKSRSTSLKKIHMDWLNFLLYSIKKNKNLFYIKILYIELDKIKEELFGSEKIIGNIYNRFFRSSIEGGSKYFFNRGYNKILIDTIYHDEDDSKEQHDYISWHTCHSINKKNDKKVSVKNEDIIFLNSNHRRYFGINNDFARKTTLIQFIDIILGSLNQNIHYTSRDSYKIEISKVIRPLAKCLLENKCDYYKKNYKKYINISFFPENELNSKVESLVSGVLINTEGNFYNKKSLKMPDENQGNLDIWF